MWLKGETNDKRYFNGIAENLKFARTLFCSSNKVSSTQTSKQTIEGTFRDLWQEFPYEGQKILLFNHESYTGKHYKTPGQSELGN